MLNKALICVSLLSCSLVAGCIDGCGPNYSDGERTGVVIKLSQRGFIWKSWEGEMNIGSAAVGEGGMAVPTVFRFNVSDEAVSSVQSAQRSGKRVTLVYRQWAVKPATIDSPYVVASVREL